MDLLEFGRINPQVRGMFVLTQAKQKQKVTIISENMSVFALAA